MNTNNNTKTDDCVNNINNNSIKINNKIIIVKIVDIDNYAIINFTNIVRRI